MRGVSLRFSSYLLVYWKLYQDLWNQWESTGSRCRTVRIIDKPLKSDDRNPLRRNTGIHWKFIGNYKSKLAGVIADTEFVSFLSVSHMYFIRFSWQDMFPCPVCQSAGVLKVEAPIITPIWCVQRSQARVHVIFSYISHTFLISIAYWWHSWSSTDHASCFWWIKLCDQRNVSNLWVFIENLDIHLVSFI